MPHIDDGIMHAYLDGALHALSDAGELPDGMSIADVTSHLSACADCRARLEAERGIREQAGVVLRDLEQVDVTVPPFADVVGAPVVRTRRQPRFMPLAWAATVVLALGAGWWGSAIFRAQGTQEMAAIDQVESSTESATPDPMAFQRAGAAGASADATGGDAAMNSDVTTGSDVANTGVAEVDVSDADAFASNAARSRARQAAASPTDVTEAAALRALAARAETGRVDTQMIAEAPPVAPPQVASADATADARREARSNEQSADPIGNAIGKIANAESFEAGAADDFGTFAGMLSREQAGRMPFVRVDEQAAVSGQVFIVANASAPVIEVAQEVGQSTVRVRQILASGESVEVVTWQSIALALDQVVVVTGAPPRDSTRDTLALRRRAETLALVPRSAPLPPAPPPAAQQSRALADSGAADALKAAGAPAAPAFLVSTEPPRTLPDGRRELVLRSASGPLWIAIRADLAPAALLDLVPHLTRAAASARQ
jgi:hypothetical protein